MCGICEIVNEAPIKEFNDEDYDRLIGAIAAGIVTTSRLDFDTYKRTAGKLTEGVYKGYGKSINEVAYGSEDYLMLFDLRRNAYVFSGAKCYQEVREVSALLTAKDTNEIKSFGDFKVKAKEVLTKYNEEYLHAEYNSAIAQSRSNSQFSEFIKDKGLYPSLQYHTVGDGRVRPEHADMDGIIRPVSDNFWRKYMPPNGWNCRCTVLQSDSTDQTNLTGFHPSNVPEVFKMNSYYDRVVFSPKHPYFVIEPKDKNNAKQNWGIPLH